MLNFRFYLSYIREIYFWSLVSTCSFLCFPIYFFEIVRTVQWDIRIIIQTLLLNLSAPNIEDKMVADISSVYTSSDQLQLPNIRGGKCWRNTRAFIGPEGTQHRNRQKAAAQVLVTGKRCKFCPGIAVTRVLKIYFFFHHHIQGSILLGECIWLCKLPLTVLEVRRRIRSEPARDLTLGEGIPRRESRYYSRILLLQSSGPTPLAYLIIERRWRNGKVSDGSHTRWVEVTDLSLCCSHH